MHTEKVITNFDALSDVDLDSASSKAQTSLTGNGNFTFANKELDNFTASQDTYHKSIGNLATGGTQAVIAKDLAKTDLKSKFSIIAKEVNRQANGDLAKLQSSGIDLVKAPTHQKQSMPTGLKVKNGDGTDMLVSVDTCPIRSHGTIFAFTPATNADPDPNNWRIKHSNGHSLTIKGLTTGVAYLFTAAYKGLDEENLVFAPPISKVVSN